MPQKPIILFLIGLLFYIGNHGGSYYASHILMELGVVISLGIYGLLAWYGLFCMDQDTWKRWVYLSFGMFLFVALGWSIVFGIRYDQNVLFSFFASRKYFFILFCPIVFLAWGCGIDIKDLRRAIAWGGFALMVNYITFVNVLDLEAMYYSSNPKLNSLITHDEWRGYRLKPPTYNIMMMISFSIMLLSHWVSFKRMIMALIILILGIHIWTIIQARSTLATLILTIVSYPFLTYGYRRLPLFLGTIPIAVMAVYGLVTYLSQGEVSADGADVRAYAYERALNAIGEQPLWGAGQASSYSLSYADIMGPKFFPEDIGLVGMTYQYGFIGITLYLFMHFYILVKLWQTNWEYRAIVGRHEPIVWGIFIWMSAQTLNLALNLGLAQSHGMTVAGAGIALCSIYRRMLQSGELQRRRLELQNY